MPSLDQSRLGSPGLKVKSALSNLPASASPNKKVNYVARNKSVIPSIRKNAKNSSPETDRKLNLYDEVAEHVHLKAI